MSSPPAADGHVLFGRPTTSQRAEPLPRDAIDAGDVTRERTNGEACVSLSGGVGLITNAAGKAIIVASFP